MNVVAFDLGSTMAAAYCAASVPKTVSETFKGNRTERAGHTMLWLNRLFREIKQSPVKLSAVAYERPFARGEYATRALWGIAGLIEAAAFSAGFPVFDFTPTEIKKWATGDYHAEKDAMITWAQMDGYSGNNEHEADAWCLMRFAEANLEIAE